MATETPAILKVEQRTWADDAQSGELDFHKRPNIRSDDKAFVEGNIRLFKSLGYSPDQFKGKTVIDIGAGSRLRGKYFNDVDLVALEPLADKFIEEVKWCDLTDARVYSKPAEELVEDLVGTGDLIFSINVLDHCYDFEKVCSNIYQYMSDTGRACLSFDCHGKVDKLHPIIVNEKIATQIFFDLGFQINQMRRTPSYHKSIADYSITFFMSKGQ